MTNPEFKRLRDSIISQNSDLECETSNAFSFRESAGELIIQKYAYQFDWLGRPYYSITSGYSCFPKKKVFSSRPDLIVETGIAHGGSLVLSASSLSF